MRDQRVIPHTDEVFFVGFNEEFFVPVSAQQIGSSEPAIVDFDESQHNNTGQGLGKSEENRMQRFDFDIGGFEYSIAIYDWFFR